MNEKLIERKLRKAVKELGGLALKLFSPFFTGLPDRLVLLPGGIIWFVELKSTGKRSTPRQAIVQGILRRLGFRVETVENAEELESIISRMTAQIHRYGF